MSEPVINDTIKNKYDNSPFRIPIRNKDGIVDYALVDEDDFEKVNQYKWNFNGEYVQTSIKSKSMRMHHFTLKKPDNENVIDHIDGDKLNNTKGNLREVSKLVNGHNQKKRNINASSKYKGVTWDTRGKNWRSTFLYKNKRIFLGYFEVEEEAAKKYDICTFKLFGKDAHNNNLVNYEDTLNINIDDIIKNPSNKYDTPQNIQYNKKKNRYTAVKIYKKKEYRGVARITIEEAVEDLEQLEIKIFSMLFVKDILDSATTPITRNNDGIPFIKVKDTEVLVDEDSWHQINKISWYIDKGYINSYKEGKMHRYVIKAKENEIVDHINNVKHDNRTSNLRLVSKSLNSYNRTKKKNASSKYFGVYTNLEKWQSYIKHNGKSYYVGIFEKEEDAAEAYNKKAIELYGENANLNVFD